MSKAAIGQRHRTVRETILKMSVADYARTLSVKENTVYSWENGRTSVPQTALAYLERHGISAGWMLTGEGPQKAARQRQEPTVELEHHLGAMQRIVTDLKQRPINMGVRIPMLSIGVSAGTPTASDDTIEREIDLAEMLLEHPEQTYFIRVVGDSMTDAGISNGDTLIVDCAVDPKPGQVVIAKVFGELTVKRYMQRNGRPVLRAENKRYKDIAITADMDFRIVGVVRSCIKAF